MDDNVYKLHQPSQGCDMEEARIKGRSGQRLLLETAGGVENARQAVSCLVRPEVNDWVLITRTPSSVYVLAVLERAGPDNSPTTLSVNGPLTISSPEEINLASRSAHLMNGETKITSEQVSMVAGKLEATTDEVISRSRSVRLIGKAFDLVAERVTRQAKTLLSRVQGQEVRQSGDLTQQVTRTHMQQSRQTVVDARKDLRMNAERIHMG